jgi:4-hydroxybenzoate polyprenyltransferase/phosphoglycolate phosphatase-like HAD superfamily hydrolase
MTVQTAPPVAKQPSELPPLVVDLDGTLIRSDTLIESALLLLKRNPLYVFYLLAWVLRGPLVLKERLAARVQLNPRALPWREDLVQWLQGQHALGRRLVLATAAHRSVAQAAAQHLPMFELVLATEGSNNLKGERKLAAIRAQVGADFVYAGDAPVDLPIWRAARAAVLVGVSPALRARAQALVPIEAEFPQTPAGFAAWLRALRVHQWVKNALVFVPLFTAFEYNQPDKLLATCIVFVAFSLAASGTYVMNDLWDLESDRQHPRKRERAFASGRIPLLQGVLAAGLLLLTGLALAIWVSVPAAGALAGYVVLTTTYSWFLKSYVLIDVLTLALLYTYRVQAGAVAASIAVSPWLLAFSIFTFFSLALVKRCAELVTLQQMGRNATRGRDYRVADLVVLWPLGVAASLSAVVVFGLYVATPETGARFAQPQLLWLVAMGLMYWFGRLWIKTARGEMHDDPIVYALRDAGSRVAVLAMLLVCLLAYWPQ